jgi:hypothetical protein
LRKILRKFSPSPRLQTTKTEGEIEQEKKKNSSVGFAASRPPKLPRFVSAADDILERPAVNCVVRALCVCYQQVRAGRRESGESV